jgi:tetratricopeptide (TPR) repeat protein
MSNLQVKLQSVSSRWLVIAAATVTIGVSGCGPNYYDLRHDGQRAMIDGAYGPACYFFQQAEELRPRRVENLHDLGACSVMLARQKFQQMNHAAAMRELDRAVGYYSEALDEYPAHQASIEGKNIALELKGQFDEALEHAEWVAEFVGPSAKQYIFLAGELEERGDADGALLRYRQAAAVEPKNATAHVAVAKFLIRHKNELAAIDHLQAAYRLDPGNEWVVDQLAARGALPPLGAGEANKP